jgi:hypothetical protein
MNLKEFANAPTVLLSPDEKVRELKKIVKEQEKEINLYKVVSENFINRANPDGKHVNINELFKKIDNEYDTNVRIIKN